MEDSAQQIFETCDFCYCLCIQKEISVLFVVISVQQNEFCVTLNSVEYHTFSNPNFIVQIKFHVLFKNWMLLLDTLCLIL